MEKIAVRLKDMTRKATQMNIIIKVLYVLNTHISTTRNRAVNMSFMMWTINLIFKSDLIFLMAL